MFQFMTYVWHISVVYHAFSGLVSSRSSCSLVLPNSLLIECTSIIMQFTSGMRPPITKCSFILVKITKHEACWWVFVELDGVCTSASTWTWLALHSGKYVDGVRVCQLARRLVKNCFSPKLYFLCPKKNSYGWSNNLKFDWAVEDIIYI
jgi:hypothetical protein